MRQLASAAIFVVLISGGVDIAHAQNNFVARRYHCRSADRPDTGDQTISANGSSCAASRQAIQQTVQARGGDPCRSWDRDYWTVSSEEIQVSNCPPQ
jgi:hypothetical protein